MSRTKFCLLVSALGLPVFINGCQDGTSREAPLVKVELAPTTMSAVPGQDFTDSSGRHWICNGKVELHSVSALQPTNIRATPSSDLPPPPQTMTLEELAQKLRPRRLVGQYEYQLAEPDYLVAQKIREMTAVPQTTSWSPSTSSGTTPKYVIGADERHQVSNAAVFPGSAFAVLTQDCTATMIGPSTALSAAHCFYQVAKGGWISTGYMAFGANNFGTWGTHTHPFGTFVFDSITIPGA